MKPTMQLFLQVHSARCNLQGAIDFAEAAYPRKAWRSLLAGVRCIARRCRIFSEFDGSPTHNAMQAD